MATVLAPPKTVADLKGKVDPDWCPGCGDFGVLAAVEKGLGRVADSKSQRGPPSAGSLFIQLPGYINTYGMHTLHGRALAVATGLKLANHELTVPGDWAVTETASGSGATILSTR